jgi:hypothetical protein
MAEAAQMTSGDTLSALDNLLEHELVEFDAKLRVLRICTLPDAGEWPCNGNIVRGWWNRFSTVPACPVRDAHIKTLRWIVDQGAADARKSLSHDHIAAWSETFASIPMPAPRRRGVRRIADSDTSTPVQPSLFHSASLPAASICAGDVTPTTIDTSYPQVSHSPQSAGPTSDPPIRELNKIRVPETVSKPFREGEGEGEILFFSPELPNEGPERSRSAPVLRVVPPYTVEDVTAVLREHDAYDSTFDKSHAESLQRVHESWLASRVSLEDFRVLGQYSAKSGARINARWLIGADLAKVIEHARSALSQVAERLAMLREFVPSTA